MQTSRAEDAATVTAPEGSCSGEVCGALRIDCNGHPLSKIFFRAAVLASAAALVASTLIMTATAAQATDGQGLLVINVVDQYGNSSPGYVEVWSTDGSRAAQDMTGGGSTALASHTVPVPAGGYAIESTTPWGGAVAPTSAGPSAGPTQRRPPTPCSQSPLG